MKTKLKPLASFFFVGVIGLFSAAYINHFWGEYWYYTPSMIMSFISMFIGVAGSVNSLGIEM